MAIVLINIGNTHTTWASGEPGSIRVINRHPTARITRDGWQAPTLPAMRSDVEVMGASVVPKATERIWRGVNLPMRWLDAPLAEYVGLDLSVIDKTTIGADRLANAIAAIHELPLPALVVDCGTAFASVLVDERKRVLGGFILPGRKLQRMALKRHTGQLPVVPMSDAPPMPYGINTPGCIRAGIDLGVPGAVAALITAVRDQLGAASLTTIAIGGDRDYLVQRIPDLTAGPDDFTLRGIAYAATMI